MKTNKKLLLTMLSTIGAVSIATPTIALTSCSSKQTNENNNPVKPLPPVDTSHITTFADAKAFMLDYLKKNYTKEMFVSDLNNFADLYKNIFPSINFSFDNIKNNGTINLKITDEYDTDFEKSTNTIILKNVPVTPLIIISNKNITIGIGLPLFVPRTLWTPENSGSNENSFNKNDFIGNQIITSLDKKTNLENKLDLNWFRSNVSFNDNLIYYDCLTSDPSNPDVFPYTFPLISFNIIFSNILQQEINNHLYKKI